MQKIPGIMIAAPKSGSGKTAVTCALLELFRRRKMCPGAFKCGPDYIDQMFHRKVIGVPSYNLDSYFLKEEELRQGYFDHVKNCGIAVAEGAMGLFDGVGGVWEKGSAYHIASILQMPIVLVADVHGMGRSILPLLAGFLQYDREKLIAGVILNRTSKSFYERIAPLIESELSVTVFGFLPSKAEFAMESRHLGLKLPAEMPDLQNQVAGMAGILEENVDVGKIIKAALAAEGRQETLPEGQKTKSVRTGTAVRIGVAKDEAFCFYYEENLELLEQMGAELVFFSPLHDKSLPERLDGMLLGGGYPELYAKELEENSGMREAVRRAIEDGMPSVAECGGFMYLHETLENEKKECYRMCGVVPGKCFYTGKLVRFGYIELEERKQGFLKSGARIRGHEFHYYDSTDNGQDCIARKPAAEWQWDCIHGAPNSFWGFPHLYYPSNPSFAGHLIENAKKYHEVWR